MTTDNFKATQPPSKVLHICNLPYETTEGELKELCTPFGRLAKTKLNVGANRNQAFAEFTDINSAIQMITYFAGSAEPAKVRGKTVYLQYSTMQEIVNSSNTGETSSNVLLVTLENLTVISYGLTQYDVEEVGQYVGRVFDQKELEALYKRFRNLDKGRKGYITAEEFLAIPELSINPLAQRIVRMFESVNYKEFVKLLAAFSEKASREDKLAFMFQVYDVDGDGLISRADMQIMLRQLGGSSLSDEDVSTIIDKAFAEANVADGLDADAFKIALGSASLEDMAVEVPVML